MKKMFCLILLFAFLDAQAFIDPKVGGVVTINKALEKNLSPNGVLYVFAKKAGPDSNPADHSPPIAVIKIEHPKFPQAFVLTPKNVMIQGSEFKGPLHVIARFSQSGDASDKVGGFEGIDPKFPSAELGNKNLNSALKAISK